MYGKKLKKTRIALSALCIALSALLCSAASTMGADENEYGGDLDRAIDKLNVEIDERKGKTEELERQRRIYEENIKNQKNKILSLSDELSYVDYRIEDTKNSIEIQEIEIEKYGLEIDELQSEIREKEGQIGVNKERLAEFIRQMYQYDRKSYLEVLLLNDSFSEFFDQVKYLEDFQNSLKDTLDEVKGAKEEMESNRNELQEKKESLKAGRDYLEEKNMRLEIEKTVKNVLLEQTKGEEKKFRDLVAEIQKEVREINSEIIRLEEEARQKLAEKKLAEEQDSSFGDSGKPPFSWPVPFKKITARFHDPDYPYRRWIGEHTGVDLRASQGTVLKATAAGYVAKARDGGRWGYSYILIVHDDGFSSLYGHVSQIDVSQGDYVSRGQVIGKTGGAPGTPGAGSYSTGAHLHFEVRLNSEPVDPLKYLAEL